MKAVHLLPCALDFNLNIDPLSISQNCRQADVILGWKIRFSNNAAFLTELNSFKIAIIVTKK